MTATSGDGDREPPVAVNENFTIELPSNPSAGYGWEVTVDRAAVSASEAEFVEDHGGVGTGGGERFSFELLGTGATKIRFVYKRAWEKEAARLLTFTVIASGDPGE